MNRIALLAIIRHPIYYCKLRRMVKLAFKKLPSEMKQALVDLSLKQIKEDGDGRDAW